MFRILEDTVVKTVHQQTPVIGQRDSNQRTLPLTPASFVSWMAAACPFKMVFFSVEGYVTSDR